MFPESLENQAPEIKKKKENLSDGGWQDGQTRLQASNQTDLKMSQEVSGSLQALSSAHWSSLLTFLCVFSFITDFFFFFCY